MDDVGNTAEGQDSVAEGHGPTVSSDHAVECLAERLFVTSYVDLVRLAAAVLRDQARAEDVVQDSFAKIQTKLRRLRNPDSALAYLRKSVLNGARSELRRHRGRPRGPLDDRSAETAPRAEDQAITRLGHSKLLRAVAELPTRQRHVILLRFLQELTLAETASTLRITVGAVKASQHRALDSLKQRLGDQI